MKEVDNTEILRILESGVCEIFAPLTSSHTPQHFAELVMGVAYGACMQMLAEKGVPSLAIIPTIHDAMLEVMEFSEEAEGAIAGHS